MKLFERCHWCDGRLTCPDKPMWVAPVCILSPLAIPAALVVGVVVTR